MTTETDEQERELRRRLIPHVADGLSFASAELIGDAVGSLVQMHPAIATQILEVVFDLSEYWCQRISREVIGIPDDEDWSIAELIDVFVGSGNNDETQEDDLSGINWRQEGF